MESKLLIVFVISFLSLVHGYTPTFRNEATHPLKAPTESTLQMNDESSGRTNSNIQKHETYFTGGKHFEYMLLNGSNILLTSLQNDSPYDIPPEQVVSPKNELFTKSNYIENKSTMNQSKVENNTEKSNSTVKNNYTAITKLKSNHNSTWFLVNTVPEQSVTKFSTKHSEFQKFEKTDISSPTKLYSKRANKSDENFATFSLPMAPKPIPNIYNEGDTEREEKPPQKQIYDYDDSFTKLLISNGILKPDAEETEKNENIQSSTIIPSTEKPEHKVAKKFNGTNITNMVNDSITSTYNYILQDRRPSNSKDTEKPSLRNINTTVELKSTQTPQTEKITSTSLESTKIIADSTQSDTNGHNESSTKSTGITSNSVGDLNIDESPRIASEESNTLSIILNANSKRNLEKLPRTPKKYDPSRNVTKKNVSPDVMIFNNFMKTENSEKPLNTKNITNPVKISVKSFSNKAEDLDELPSMTKFYPISTSKVVQSNEPKKNNVKNDTSSEFKNIIEKSIKHLFMPVAKFFNNYKENLPGSNFSVFEDGMKNFKINIEDSKDVKVTLKSFAFTNLVEVLKNKTKFNEQKMSRVDRDLLQIKPKESIFNWTDLNDGKNINLEDSINELFSEDDDVHWFVLLLAGNSTIAQMRKEDFVKYLKVNLAARLSLEYNDIKINAIIVVPPNLAVNVSLPANESLVNVNEEVNLEENQKIGSIHELAETNATLLELSGQEYHVVQLLCLKSQQSIQNGFPQAAKVIERKHEDVEFYVFVVGGIICLIAALSPVLYGLFKLLKKRLASLTIRIPDIFKDKLNKQVPHEKISESTCESLNVIFSEDFDRKYSSNSWFDNTKHSSSILKPTTDVPPAFFTGKEENFADLYDITRNPIENSPRLNKENKLNMLSCRPSCVFLPHQGKYLIESEFDQDKYFDNPNYNHDTR